VETDIQPGCARLFHITKPPAGSGGRATLAHAAGTAACPGSVSRSPHCKVEFATRTSQHRVKIRGPCREVIVVAHDMNAPASSLVIVNR